MSPTVRQATDAQLLAHHARLESDFEFFPLLTEGIDLHAIEEELRRRGYRRAVDHSPWWAFWRRPVERWAIAECAWHGRVADHLAEYWDRLENGATVNGLISAMRVLADATEHEGLQRRVSAHDAAGLEAKQWREGGTT